ncbi:MAG: serine/threonine protein kinase [Pseudanabaena sp. RU_4_16]|nr:serine/threonine protein kinase [Pseudanabaena sp. RU_4_16]
MDTPLPTNPWIGRTVGDRNRYRISDHLGGGGMGDVFLAVDTLLGQEVAIKMVKERLVSTADLRKRFEREVLLCAAIKSDNVVQVKDYGVTADGYPFYVMEYLTGQTLGQLLRQEKRLSRARSAYIMHQICAGLQLAHEGVIMWHDGSADTERVQVIHRDLKPENIFLISTSLGELVKILDFGIAKIANNHLAATNTGLFMGTFQYASPEQLEVRKDLDERADIYSLGIILYEMLSGTDPFGCSERRDVNGLCWVRSHISEKPTPLRSQPGCEQLPEPLEAAVMRCLQKSPRDRFASVKELDRAIQNAIGMRFDNVAAGANISQTSHSAQNTTLEDADRSLTILTYEPTIAEPPKQHSDRSEIQPAQTLTEISLKRLESLLAKYIGPIASLVLKKELAACTHFIDLVERLSAHVPANKQKEFQSFSMELLGGGNHPLTVIQPKTTKPSSDSGAISAFTINLRNVPVDENFVHRCEHELADLIGPMAKLIVQRSMKGKNSVPDLVEAIALQIPNPQTANEFRRRVIN